MAAASCAACEARNGVGACRSLVHDDKRERLCKAACVITGICKASHTAHLPAVATGAFVSPLRYISKTLGWVLARVVFVTTRLVPHNTCFGGML